MGHRLAIIALVSGVPGFTGLSGTAMDIAQTLFWIAVVIAAIFLGLGFTLYKKIT